MKDTQFTTLVAVSIETIRFAEKEIRACQACTKTADVTFSRVLDRITHRNGATTDYVMYELARCPSCARPILEQTLVEWW